MTVHHVLICSLFNFIFRNFIFLLLFLLLLVCLPVALCRNARNTIGRDQHHLSHIPCEDIHGFTQRETEMNAKNTRMGLG